MSTDEPSCLDILRRLKSTDPPLWLAPNPSLSQQARTASLGLFSSLRPYAPHSPLDHLLIDGFDAEQIWQQIELQSHPLLSLLKREVKRFEKSPREISRIFADIPQRKDIPREVQEREGRKEEEDVDEFDEDEAGASEDLDEERDGAEEEEDDGAEEEEEDGDEDESENGDEGAKGGIEDGFLKIKELEEYLQKDEAREYGFEGSTKKKPGNKERRGIDEDDSSEEGEEDDGDDDEPGGFGLDDNDDDEDEDDDEEEEIENARYEDFFGGKRKKAQRKPKVKDNSEEDASEEEDGDDRENGNEQGNHNLSTHEKELLNMKSKIEQMEKANLEPKTWTMQGEVTAAKRPKNSALEVDLDFEHNARPAPVITEEVTASLEDLIRKRIMEAHFNDVEKPPSLPGKGPREMKELDENKSKKGLAEIYEDEYAQKANLVSAPSSFSDEQKKEATLLFKKLCLKLDALSHFHFAPKPVIEDMSIQANVPALAMEEIAPLAVSDAAMLAPEEVFSGKGDVKDESELTQVDRKRRRAKKKRIHKAEEAKRMAKKTKHRTMPNPEEGKED